MTLPGMINAYDPGASDAVAPREEAMIARRQHLLGPAYRLFYQEPVHVVRGEGVWLYDPDGNAYLDCYNNVASLGHSHPDVVAAVSRQWATLNTHTCYLHNTILDYSERLLGTFPPSLGHVMFTCTGSEANDLAFRIAKAHTGGTGVIVTDFAYHGTTEATAQFSPSLGPGNSRGPHIRTIPAPDGYRREGTHLGAAMAADIRAAIADLEANGIKFAAFLCDTIFSSDGVFADPPGFLAPVVAEVHAAGGLFIADEVQPGFGRTGATLWGFMRQGVEPDLVTLGKPMGNGQPMGGVVGKPELIEAFARRTRYFNTFGGNPVSCAAGLAVLDVIEQERIVENARKIGDHLAAGLRQLAEDHDRIGDVRGVGLFIGVELVEDRVTAMPNPALASRLVNDLRRRRILISAAGRHGHILKIRPPLTFGTNHADHLLAALAEGFES